MYFIAQESVMQPSILPRQKAIARRPYRPCLEALELRCVPSTVTNLLDSGPGSLRQAILDTPTGGTVDFQVGLRGRITLTSGELLINKDLTIAGPGAGFITVSGNHASRVFGIHKPNPTTVPSVAIAGLTIADGQSPSDRAGAIENLLCALVVSDCVITGNSVQSTTNATGGGIENEAGMLTVINTTISGNSVTGGNSAVISGGGIDNSATTGVVTIINSTLSDNSANGTLSAGGGIANGGTLTITDSTLSGNISSAGGAILNTFTGSLSLLDSTLSGNSAVIDGPGTGLGGAVYAEGGPFTMIGCTVSGNSATRSLGSGGGIFASGSAGPVLRNDIVAGNTGPFGPDIYGPVASQGHNLIGDGTAGGGFIASDLVGTSAQPIDPLLGPLQGNGGPTRTMALLTGSPAIDAGDNSGAPDTDQRGFARIVNGTIDIGDFEVQSAGQATHLAFQAPASVQAGTPFTVTVAVLDDFGQQVNGYTGTVHVTATSGGHRDYTFMASDQGQHTFSGLVVRQAGPLTIAGADTATPAITGNVTFTITPAAANHLAFDVPSTITAGVPFAITVTVQDIYGNTVTGYTNTVHFAASRGGDVFASRDYAFTAADAGQHTFTGLVLDQPADYTIMGEVAGISGSVTFTVDPG
jgi:hypothetical protein